MSQNIPFAAEIVAWIVAMIVILFLTVKAYNPPTAHQQKIWITRPLYWGQMDLDRKQTL